ncbi:MAG: hypothetical protein HYY25_04690 [Candidatus Wallbacteria bacterium]|nr:hypothetical protein [Candidatus Wallbacteria bacterium]
MVEYDPHSWWAHFWDIRGSMVRAIGMRVLVCTLWACLVVEACEAGLPLAVPPTGHGLVGVALGLLLVFRTNASYDRFWEGRKMWGGIVNQTRNLARGASAMLTRDPSLAGALIRWTACFPTAVMNSLRGGKGLGSLALELPPDEVQSVMSAEHTPLAVSTRMTALLCSAQERGLLTPHQLVWLDGNIQSLVDYMGACERIQKTPLPFAYVVHLRRALLLYCYTLPFATVKDFGMGAALCTLLIAYTFFGIEEIGVEIENPFGADDNDLPLERICSTIDTNLRAMLPRPE